MIVKTKKTRLSPSKYIRVSMLNILRQQWWISIPAILISAGLVYLDYKKFAVIPAILLVLYVLFWFIQFYSLTKMEENKLLFGRLFYEFNKDRVIIFLDSKRGMPIEWKRVVSARVGKDYFMLMLSKVQFIYIPHGAFQNEQQINLVRMLLKNKKLIK